MGTPSPSHSYSSPVSSFSPSYSASYGNRGNVPNLLSRSSVGGRGNIFSRGSRGGGGGYSAPEPEKKFVEPVGGISAAQANSYFNNLLDNSFNGRSDFGQEVSKKSSSFVDSLRTLLDEINNDPLEPQEFKDSQFGSVVGTTERKIGSLFTSPVDFLNEVASNPDFQKSLNELTKNGGSLEGVLRNIGPAVSASDGPMTPTEFLARVNNPNANVEAQRQAIDELTAESQIAQDEIARQAGLSEDLRRLYFGDEKEIGIYDMKVAQAAEEILIIEQKEKDAQRTARDKANLQIEKDRAEYKKQKAKVEASRLRAKNYITTKLGKLGALKTTCLLYTSPSPRDRTRSRMPSSA